jgi:thiamine biosynthesis lipoprotein
MDSSWALAEAGDGERASAPAAIDHRAEANASRHHPRGTGEYLLRVRRGAISGCLLELLGVLGVGRFRTATSSDHDHGRLRKLSVQTRIHTFRAMGTDVTLLAPMDAQPTTFDRASREVEQTFACEDLRFSRFRADSELTRVNASAGRWVSVSPRFAAVTGFALEAARATNGLFDPTVLPALIAAGYDRDFDEVLAGARGRLQPSSPCGRFAEVRLRRRRLFAPSGVALDLGGLAKGWTVDIAVAAAVAAGLPWALVNAGGDLRVAGASPLEGIEVGVEDPDNRDDDVLRVRLVRGALATSSVRVRAWGEGLHHLIDPRTGAPADSNVVQTTAWAETCAAAEILSTWALLEGPAYMILGPAILVMADGRILSNLQERELEDVGT